MDHPFASAMQDALAQVRAGDPAAATRIIQQALSGRAEAGPDGQPVIDGQARRVAPEGARETPAAPPRPTPPRAETRAPQAARPAGGLRMRLGQAVDLLREGAGRIVPLPGQPAATPDHPAGGRWDRLHFQGQAGARDYRLYVPQSVAGAPQGLILLLHGCTQSPEDFVTGTGMIAQAERARLILVIPEQTRADNPQLCWNWFRPADQTGPVGEAALLAELAARVAVTHSVPQDRIFAAGLSAGGAMAATLGAEYPQVFAAVGVHSGLPAGAARDLAGALAAMRSGGAAGRPVRSRLIVFHGSADATVAPGNGGALFGSAPGTPGGTESGLTGRPWRVTRKTGTQSRPQAELWEIDGLGHAWSGGDPRGSYTDPRGPDASALMVAFFLR